MSVLVSWATRGPYLPHPHSHHDPYTSGSGLWGTLAHGIAWGFGTRTGSGIAALLPPGVLVLVGVAAVLGWLVLRKRTRR